MENMKSYDTKIKKPEIFREFKIEIALCITFLSVARNYILTQTLFPSDSQVD